MQDRQDSKNESMITFLGNSLPSICSLVLACLLSIPCFICWNQSCRDWLAGSHGYSVRFNVNLNPIIRQQAERSPATRAVWMLDSSFLARGLSDHFIPVEKW